jgi:hypothetical protein
MNSLNQKTLRKRLGNFWGFGRYESEYWFVGMEEGGGDEIREVSRRLAIWERLGSPELVDNYEYHLGIRGYGYERFFEGNMKLQKTWAKLIRTLLNVQDPNKIYTVSDIKQYQAHCWGRKDSNNCLIDIFPLPSPSANRWYYDKWSEITILKSRDTYKSSLQDKRIDTLRKRIAAYKPKVVMFYAMGTDYAKIWEQVAETRFTAEKNFQIFNDKSVYISKKEETLFVMTYQPNAVWNNEYWNKVGKFVNEQF